LRLLLEVGLVVELVVSMDVVVSLPAGLVESDGVVDVLVDVPSTFVELVSSVFVSVVSVGLVESAGTLVSSVEVV
jgi:formylmethanofuran dehydrogenase subunit B